MLGVGVFEGEAGAFDGDDEIDRRAGKQILALGVDKDLDAVAFDDRVFFLRRFDQAHHIFIARASAGFDHDAQP